MLVNATKRAGSVFTVDVEDWFHILDVPSTPPLEQWNSLPSRVEGNFERLLQLFEEKNVRTTCFFLGWVAERFPHLVRAAADAGHEIASHGCAHRLVYTMSPPEFRSDARRAREILEDVSGHPVLGYRAAGFSLIKGSEWFFDELSAAGYLYDSSVFPAKRGHGGMRDGQRREYVVPTANGRLLEIPITVAEFFGATACFFGGGYLRVTPYWMIRAMAQRVQREGRTVVFYIHPREIDAHHPRLKMPVHRYFKCYANLSTTMSKVARILDDFGSTPLSQHFGLETTRRDPQEVATA